MIRPFTLSELSSRCDGQLFGSDLSYKKVSTDSRDCRDAVFVALRGDRFDGHRFIEDAVSMGCLAVVTEEAVNEQVSSVQVADTRKCLGVAGALNREVFEGKVVGITGSSGKTTTKNMLNAILSLAGPVVATEGNFNNEIGVPLTLLRMQPETRFAVVEMGARRRGDIAYLGEFVKPDIALVLNAGVAHIGEFGSYEAIVETKGEIYETIQHSGIAVLNVDDKACAAWEQRVSEDCQLFRYSVEDSTADVFADNINYQDAGSSFELVYGQARQQVTIHLPGKHNVSNAAAAAALALVCGCSMQQVADGLASLHSSDGRMTRLELGNGLVVLDDSYNANPISVKAALDVLKMQSGATIAALGEMGELGAEALDYHVEVAAYARDLGVGQLCCFGPYAHEMVETFGQGASAFESKEALAQYLLKEAPNPAVILVKGSRMAGMEAVVKFMCGGLH